MSYTVKAANQFLSERKYPILDMFGTRKVDDVVDNLFHKTFPTVKACSVKELLPALDEALTQFVQDMQKTVEDGSWQQKSVMTSLELTWTIMWDMGRRGIFPNKEVIPQNEDSVVEPGNLLGDEDFAELANGLRNGFCMDCIERAEQMQKELGEIWKNLDMKKLMQFIYQYNIYMSFKQAGQ